MAKKPVFSIIEKSKFGTIVKIKIRYEMVLEISFGNFDFRNYMGNYDLY